MTAIMTSAIPGAPFCALVRLDAGDARAAVAVLEAHPAGLPRAPTDLTRALGASQGLLLLRGLEAISQEPPLLVRLSRLFGLVVENYLDTGMEPNKVHPSVPEILIVSIAAPVHQPTPARPVPALTAEGALPVCFPHRRGWHTDQSYRRPPPDISLFYAVQPAPAGQGQTLYANGTGAYAALSPAMQKRIEGLHGIHVKPRSGRSEQAVRAGETPKPLSPLEQPQRQPLVRTHPVTGQRALFLCEAGQMDWISGPIEGLGKGPDGEGAALLYELMAHYTSPPFTYVHEWQRGDLVVYDNRSTILAATWFDSDRHQRVMWRTTVWGNPGAEYAGVAKSWVGAGAVRD